MPLLDNLSSGSEDARDFYFEETITVTLWNWWSVFFLDIINQSLVEFMNCVANIRTIGNRFNSSLLFLLKGKVTDALICDVAVTSELVLFLIQA